MRNQQRCCMSSNDHSSITITIEMPDFDCLHRKVISPHVPSATECRLCSDLKSAATAVARPATTKCLLQKCRRPLCASSRAQGRRRPPPVAGSESVSCCLEHHCHSSESVADALCCLPPVRRPPPTTGLEIQPNFAQRFLPHL